MERVTLLTSELDVGRATLDGLRDPLPPAPGAQADDDEPARIREALARSGGNVVRAAKLLGLGRNALRNRMRRYGIDRPALDEPLPVRPAAGRAGPTAPSSEGEDEPRWEQRPVAILAIDIVLPELTTEPWTFAQRWTRTIEDRVSGFGGVFLARSPSRLTAAFGIPRALEQLPQRAVQAALAIRRLVEERAPHPELRMAVHLGTLRFDAGPDAPASRVLPAGDTLALPERLLGHAAASEILVSPQIARRIEQTCDVRARELRVGEGQVVHAHAVLGQHRRDDGADVPAQSRFVGRGRELALLRESFESAAAGHGLVAFVVGEAGIGKSRLLGELRRQLASEPHLWVEGRCASYGSNVAFLPVIDGLRRFFGIDDRDDEAAAGAKVARGIRELGPDLDGTVPYVRQVLGLPAPEIATLDSASRRSETFRALKAMTRAAATARPLVIVIEDLHWIDPASEDYLAFIAEVIPTTAALLVCSHRPGYRHPFGDHSYHVRVTLRPLSTSETGTLSGAVLGDTDVPPAVQELIAAKAEGNPFFVEEVTRSLLEDGTIRRENGGVVLAREPAAIVVPETIQDVLVARLDRLADDARRAIEVASVIGREFALRLLERITDAGARVRTQVEELRSLELIYEKATHPELAYMFKHALTHDVAYGSVLAERRRTLHRTIGLAIEELYADRLAEFFETLAHHFGRAEEWERALHYHERAAEKAAENFANRAVIVHCEEALAIADRLGARVSDDRRCTLEERAGLARFYVSEFATSARAFERAAERSPEPMRRVFALSHAVSSHFWAHAYDDAARVTDMLRALGRDAGIPLAEALALGGEGFSRGVCGGEMAAEERLVVEGIRIAEKSGDEVSASLLRFFLAQLCEWTGDYARSRALSEQVIASGRRLRLAHLVVWPGWFLGKAACCVGDYGRAIAELTEAYEVCDRIGDRSWKSRLLNTLGWCLAEVGSHARARQFNERAATVAREIGDPEIIANSEINLTVNHLGLGDFAAAGAHLEPLLAALARPGDPWMRWRYALHAYDAAGRLALAGRDPDRAAALALEEADGARRHRVPKVEARALVLRGEALLMLERPDEADAALADAVRIADGIGYPRAAWDALGWRAMLAERRGDAASGARYASRRRALLDAAARSLADDDLRRELARL
jgi:tetratricopeptide (TPR) repeat protein